MTSDEFVAKAASIVRHALPANMIPQVHKNALVDAIADGLAFYFDEGRHYQIDRFETFVYELNSNMAKRGDVGHE